MTNAPQRANEALHFQLESCRVTVASDHRRAEAAMKEGG
jgi:hypothetical protein